MRIYYIIHYFPPELNGGATRASEMARMWAEEGHEVTVITGFPNHPHGRIPPEYRGKFFVEEQVENYRVRRNFVYATPNKGKYRRIINHLSLTVSSVLGSIFGERPDVIIASSPPLFLGISGYLLSRFKRVPYVFETRDLWPQQAIELGMVRGRRMISLLEGLERFLYRKSAKVVGVTAGMRNHFLQVGVEPDKIEVIYNGTDVDKFQPGTPNVALKQELGIQDKFVVSYIGTMGLSQGLSFVLDAAVRLQENHPRIHFLLVGDGAERESLMERSQTLGLGNITFLSAQPREKIPELYHLSDAAMVLLRNVPLFHHARPSKLFELMASGIPVILGAIGEVQDIVEEAHAGICIEPENPIQLSDAIVELYADPTRLDEFRSGGREYVLVNSNRRTLSEQYLTILQQVAGRGR